MLLSYNNNTYRISYGNVTMVENALENPNLVQVSVVSGCQIVVAPNAEAGIDYLPNGEYRQWTLTGRNTRLNNAGAHRIYARLNRTAQDALIIFSLNHYTVDGRIIHTSDGGAVTLTGEPSATYYYIEIGSITATDLPTAAATQDRELLFDGGYLATPQQNTENTGGWTQLMQLTANNLINFLKNVASFTLDGTLTILGALKLNNKQATDIARQADDATEPESGSDETLPTTAWLKGKFKAWLQRYFLRKDADDKTDHSLEVGQKLTVGDIFTALGNAFVKGALTVGDYLEGVRGMSVDAMGNIKARSMELSEYLAVPTLRFNEITLFKGYNLISAGGGVEVRSVTYENGAYTISTANEENIAIPFEEDDILTGYWYNFDDSGSTPEGERIQGFGKMMFRVTAVDQTAKTFAVVPKPDSGAVPVANMTLGQTGNFTNTERQSYMVLDTRSGNCCLAMYEGVNAWEITEAMIPSWFGKRNTTRTIAGIPLNNYSAVLENIIMTGKIFQIDSITDEPILVPIDKGDYNLGQEYAYYDRVSYLGSLWLCVNENGTTEAPRENSTDWLEQVKRGEGVSGAGHWDSANTPYAANTIVSFAKCVFMSKVQTSEPPVAIMRFADGSYARMRNGGYILYGNSNSFTVHGDWTLLLDGRELQGESFQFLGDLAEAPAVPKNGDTYYNTTEKATYTYRNGTWYVMTKDGTDGKDGKDYEWIYKLGTDFNTAPAKPASVNEDDHVPEGWTDDPTGVDPTNIVEWACKRVRKSGEAWGEWSTPAPWAKFGADGKGIASITTTYQASNSGTTAPTGTWKPTAAEAAAQQGQYLWTKTIYLYTDNTSTTAYSNVYIAKDGVPGLGISSTVIEYAQSTSGTAAPTSGWSGAIPSVTDGNYLWTRTTITYTDNSQSVGYSVSRDPKDGVDGKGINSTSVQYVVSSQGNTAPTSGWGGTVPSVPQGQYLWTRTTISYTDGTSSTSYSVSYNAHDGDDGTSVTITEKSVTYQVSTSGTATPTGTWNTSVPSVPEGQYLWTKTYVKYSNGDSTTSYSVGYMGKKGNKGDKGDKGDDGESVVTYGHWQASQCPYPKNAVVTFYKGTYIAKNPTSEPPIPVLLTNTGSYIRKRDGGYILAGRYQDQTINPDWMLMMERIDGKDGEAGKDAVSYWLDSPVGVISYTSTGSLSPSAFQVTLKKGVGDTVSNCADFWLVCRMYNGSWVEQAAAVKSATLNVNSTEGYTQFTVRAYKTQSDANSWSNNYITEKGVGVANQLDIDSVEVNAPFLRDMGIYQSGKEYYYNNTYRDKVIYMIEGVYYNFMVASKRDTAVTSPPPSTAVSDSNWEIISKYESIATDTLFASGANVAGFQFANGVLRSQNETGGVPNLQLNGLTGEMDAQKLNIINKGESTTANQYTKVTSEGVEISTDAMNALGSAVTDKVRIDYNGFDGIFGGNRYQVKMDESGFHVSKGGIIGGGGVMWEEKVNIDTDGNATFGGELRSKQNMLKIISSGSLTDGAMIVGGGEFTAPSLEQGYACVVQWVGFPTTTRVPMDTTISKDTSDVQICPNGDPISTWTLNTDLTDGAGYIIGYNRNGTTSWMIYKYGGEISVYYTEN